MKLGRILADLKRRQVFKVAAVYGAVGYVVVEVADLFVPALRLPDWILTSIAFLVVLGFPVAVVLAWAFELTPEGVKRAADPPPGELEAASSRFAPGQWLLVLAALLGAGLLALAAVDALRESGDGSMAIESRSAAGARPGAAALDPEKLAVLPFDNLAGEHDEQFTLGVHADLLSRLQRIRALKVMTRNSVLGFVDSELGTREIAGELGAAYLLSGSVQRAGERLRINVYLADARADEMIWTERFDETWSVDNLLDVQARIAERVASELQVTLTAAEREGLAKAATRSEEAYGYFLLAEEQLASGYGEDRVRQAVDYAARAVESDPGFALAWALLGLAHANMYHEAFDRTPERVAASKQAVDRAVELDPNLPESHTALGYYYYWARLDYDRALEAYAVAEGLAPSSRWLLHGIASVKRRQGRMEQALDYFLREFELDPTRPPTGASAGETLYLMRRYDEAARYTGPVVELPGIDGSYAGYHALVLLNRDEETGAARAVVRRARERGQQSLGLSLLEVRIELMDRDPHAALALLERAEPVLGDVQYVYYPRELVRGWALRLAGDSVAARAAFASASAELERAREARPADERIAGALGLTYAALGRREEAVREAGRATEIMPIEAGCVARGDAPRRAGANAG